MLQPDTVARCVEAMRAAVTVPVTVKHRIGVDEFDDYAHMLRFVDEVASAGADRFSVHARKAWLSGLSPKQNRNVPPLRPDEIYRLKAERPSLPIEINGGIRDLDTAAAHLEHVDAVMIGRAAWDTPFMFAEVDQRFWGAPPAHAARSWRPISTMPWRPGRAAPSRTHPGPCSIFAHAPATARSSAR